MREPDQVVAELRALLGLDRVVNAFEGHRDERYNGAMESRGGA
jgi:hypothetical protein